MPAMMSHRYHALDIDHSPPSPPPPSSSSRDGAHRTNTRIHRFLLLLICILALALIGAGCYISALHSLCSYALPQFVFTRLPVDVLNGTSMSAVPMTMNITNPNGFTFHISEAWYTIYYSDHVMGSGKFYSLDLHPLSVKNVTVSAHIYGDNYAMHEKLLQVRDNETALDVEMKMESKLAVMLLSKPAVWSVVHPDVNFFVSCNVHVDRLKNTSVVTQSNCRSFR